ncbi:MAG: sulfite exporter TauE/SafE family protein [Neisseria sp.]|nr:sulfite exporter TauE/SafE family protein [Neisseria sp.]
MLDFSLLMIFMIGFLGGVHCVGMCGGLSSAFALQLPPHVSRLKLIVLLNIGRIASYGVIGLLLGVLGQVGIGLDGSDVLRQVLFVLAQVVLLLLGLYLAGLSALIARVEQIGVPIWKRLNPLLNKLLPIKSASASLAVGALWGWLPCGLVYSASLYALGSGNALQGAGIMLLFGLGTLPNLLAMGFFAASFKAFFQKKSVRLIAGLLVSAWAVWQLMLFFGVSV